MVILRDECSSVCVYEQRMDVDVRSIQQSRLSGAKETIMLNAKRRGDGGGER